MTPAIALTNANTLKYKRIFFGEYWFSTRYPKNRIVVCPENMESPQKICLLFIDRPMPDNSVNARFMISYVDVEFDFGLQREKERKMGEKTKCKH